MVVSRSQPERAMAVARARHRSTDRGRGRRLVAPVEADAARRDLPCGWVTMPDDVPPGYLAAADKHSHDSRAGRAAFVAAADALLGSGGAEAVVSSTKIAETKKPRRSQSRQQ